MNGGVLNMARGVSSLASQILSPQKRLEPLSDSIKAVSVITGYVKRLGESKKQTTADHYDEDFELPQNSFDLAKKFEPKRPMSEINDVFSGIENSWGNPIQIERPKNYQVPTTATVRKLGGDSKKRAHESENWDDLEIPDTIKLSNKFAQSSIDSTFSSEFSHFQPLKDKTNKPVVPKAKLSKKSTMDTETDEDFEDIEIPANSSLKLPQHRNFSSTNFFSSWNKSEGLLKAASASAASAYPASSSASSIRTESEGESFDDIIFPENPKELRLNIQNEDEDWTRDVLVPDELDLSALAKKSKKPTKPVPSRQGDRRASSREIARQNPLFSAPILISTEIYGDGTELDSIEDLKLSYDTRKSLPRQEKKRRKPILIQNKTSNQVRRVVQKMEYNPLTYKWEGNYEVLKNFENPGPKLFTPSTYSTPPIVGNMTFNQATNTWKGDFDDDDAFRDIPDLVVEEKKLHTRAFEIDDHLRQHFLNCERSHNQFFSNWLDNQNRLLVDSSDQDHLFLIRVISKGMK